MIPDHSPGQRAYTLCHIHQIILVTVFQTEDHIRVYFDAAIFNDEIQIMQIDSYTLKISDAKT